MQQPGFCLYPNAFIRIFGGEPEPISEGAYRSR